MTLTLTREEIDSLVGDTVYGSDGEKIGTVTDLFYDTTNPDQCWIGVMAGFLGLKHRTIPLDGAQLRNDDEVVVAYTKDQIMNSPDDYDEELDDERVDRLGRHYDLDWDEFHSPNREQFHDAMTRHEEELAVGKREGATGRVRLRKWVDSRDVSEDVSLRRETADVKRERLDQPVDSSADAFKEQEVDVTLRSEEPVVEKRTIARERVSLDKDVRHDSETVNETLREEHVDVDGDDVRRI